jgi:hypothetical protein
MGDSVSIILAESLLESLDADNLPTGDEHLVTHLSGPQSVMLVTRFGVLVEALIPEYAHKSWPCGMKSVTFARGVYRFVQGLVLIKVETLYVVLWISLWASGVSLAGVLMVRLS